MTGRDIHLSCFPETDKLFGHNNEVMCLAMSPDSRFIASASKARDAGTAQVLLWGHPLASTSPGMQLLSRLPGHESTVVCLEFSPNNRYFDRLAASSALRCFLHAFVVAGIWRVPARTALCVCTHTTLPPTPTRPWSSRRVHTSALSGVAGMFSGFFVFGIFALIIVLICFAK